MPLAGVSAAAKVYHEKKAAAEQGGTVFFSLGDGDEATVRFLEEGSDFTTYYVHRLPQQGNRFPQIPCLDQSPQPTGRVACPGCDDGHKRSFRFAINLIHRDAPVPERDSDNRMKKDANNKPVWKTNADGSTVVADQVKVWTGGIEVAEDLDHLDGKFGGLTSRDFEVQRSGIKLDTKYRILPTGERTPLTPKDEELKKGKFDLNQFKKPPEYDSFYSYQGGGGGGGSANGSAPSREEASTRESPFKRRQRA